VCLTDPRSKFARNIAVVSAVCEDRAVFALSDHRSVYLRTYDEAIDFIDLFNKEHSSKWRLPILDELKLLHSFRFKLGIPVGQYWTSTRCGKRFLTLRISDGMVIPEARNVRNLLLMVCNLHCPLT
jgi:hypothetical protein